MSGNAGTRHRIEGSCGWHRNGTQCGNAENDPVIRKALAIGADNVVRIDTTPSSSMDVA
ncbi:MAG: hypothetical protein R2795_14120 [Saprospiraceae bacterium]